MCNPRQVTVTATRQINEAWDREITRTVEEMEEVRGEARVVQALDSTLGSQTLRTLEMAFASGQEGWEETENGYRFNIQGGYVQYLLEQQALEIVAVLEDTISARGETSRQLSGQLDEELSVEGTGRYYDDGWGGKTEETGRKAAEKDAANKLERAKQERLNQAADAAERESEREVEEEARQQAQEKLNQLSKERRAELAEQARQNLQVVGLRGRQAFNRVLAQAYKNALLAYARNNGADNIVCSRDDDDFLEVEFTFSK